ncbi:deoxyribodipyrimidine photo-lyase [Marinobacter sp. X15-166B]|uniref:deoxyribodipyrimidine photo-lyase n=1 Tax=Marinobacter sp. X15-166B TaxID=1897620 RepID=UPI00085C90BC|nr:deoxyribodipyrimidine photo-lyase [Marinobacter sp. X15-166B]OEY66854.1 deoxyribodipyrimidine photolyase [Marinobacter sp. X15-166B]
MTRLVWFRNDLRLADNPALHAACQGDARVIACFMVTVDQWQLHDWSPARLRLVVDSVNQVSKELARLGIPLTLLSAHRFADGIDQLVDWCRTEGIRQVYCNEEYGVNERRRDTETRQRLAALEIEWRPHHDQCVAPVGSILTRQERPYSVFTPFARTWRQWTDAQALPIHPIPKARGEPVHAAQLNTDLPGYAAAPPPLVASGESAAHDQLEAFLTERGGDYHQAREYPALAGTSQISPYLASGVLSGRQCLQAVRQCADDTAAQEGLQTWVNEIAWRDFYIHILYHYPRISMHRAFKTETERLQWNPPGEAFEAWKEGRTGIPIVDAAMRQLNQTGWMHNRLRMISAMFLSKNLFVDWRLGEAYFMSKLIDGFLAANNGGWQWSASTGTDAAPYFRIFNPATQSERFDAQGRFIRQYVPEVADLDNKQIHQPWVGGHIPPGYCRPIVDLKTSRQEAIARFQALKN